MATITSYRNSPDVNSLLENPTIIPQRIVDNLDGAFVENLVFRDGGPNTGSVAYHEAAAPGLNEPAENIAEFAEIPVASAATGVMKFSPAVKSGQAVRISHEMRIGNRLDLVNKQIDGLQKNMAAFSVKATLKAFKEASVQTLAASAKWNDAAGDPVKDVLTAVEMVQTAGVDGAYFGYNPDTILISPAARNALILNEKAAKHYVGDIAHENPVFKGITSFEFAGLTVATSRWVPPDVVYVLEAGAAGFVSYMQPLTMTPFYAERGESGMGGATQSYRADCTMIRAIGVDNPKSVVQITGAITL